MFEAAYVVYSTDMLVGRDGQLAAAPKVVAQRAFEARHADSVVVVEFTPGFPGDVPH